MEDKEIIEKVQKEYPENSKEAISYAITLARLEENDYWVDRIRELERLLKVYEELVFKFETMYKRAMKGWTENAKEVQKLKSLLETEEN